MGKIKQHFTLLILVCALGLVVGIGFHYFNSPKETLEIGNEESNIEIEAVEGVVDGVHVATGLVNAKGLNQVITNCTTCHSSKLIVQNRMGKEQWNATIRWMQETQGLWDLSESQEIIVDYLITNYPPLQKGRRSTLTTVDWYELK
ncbi:monoheme cytochrome C [Maribacter sp. CXY002]|uniref:monoheme cytochrome C n=1 Tax=Maribacter luteocoastalis TaxID=3407671 RepID=UPI003B673962